MACSHEEKAAREEGRREGEAALREQAAAHRADIAVLHASVALQRTRAGKPADEDEDTYEYGEWQDALWRALEAHKEAVDALPPDHPARGQRDGK